MLKDKENSNQLEEAKVSLLGKIFLTTLGAWLVGKATNVKFKGTQSEIQAIANAMLASKRFQDELKKPGASVEDIVQKLNVKHMTAAQFEKTFGIKWPL